MPGLAWDLLSCAWAQVRWFELPPMMIFHVANAWQEGHLVKVFACCFEEVRARWLPGSSVKAVQLYMHDSLPSNICRWHSAAIRTRMCIQRSYKQSPAACLHKALCCGYTF